MKKLITIIYFALTSCIYANSLELVSKNNTDPDSVLLSLSKKKDKTSIEGTIFNFKVSRDIQCFITTQTKTRWIFKFSDSFSNSGEGKLTLQNNKDFLLELNTTKALNSRGIIDGEFILKIKE